MLFINERKKEVEYVKHHASRRKSYKSLGKKPNLIDEYKKIHAFFLSRFIGGDHNIKVRNSIESQYKAYENIPTFHHVNVKSH